MKRPGFVPSLLRVLALPELLDYLTLVEIATCPTSVPPHISRPLPAFLHFESTTNPKLPNRPPTRQWPMNAWFPVQRSLYPRTTSALASSISELPPQLTWQHLDSVPQGFSRSIYTVILDRFSCVTTAPRSSCKCFWLDLHQRRSGPASELYTVCAVLAPVASLVLLKSFADRIHFPSPQTLIHIAVLVLAGILTPTNPTCVTRRPSPLKMKPFTANLPDGHGSVYKEVRFSPTATPLRRTQSVAGCRPSASSKYGPSIAQALPQSLLDTSYIDQSRDLLESQRANFEAERGLFAKERRLWEQERNLLRTKIAELESFLKTQRNQTNGSTPHTAKLVFGTPQFQGSNGAQCHSTQVWEGTSPGGRPTRVFRDQGISDYAHLSSTTEGSGTIPPSLDAALSPQSRAADALASISVPIEKLDSSLDGITLKSSALPPGVVARVITPPSPSSLDASPGSAPTGAARPEVEHRNSLKLKLSELGPPNENLVRDAGHTPMAIIEADGSQRSTMAATPLPEKIEEIQSEEAPLAPVATKIRQPTERAESYFPDPPEDPALKGPLGLTNDEEHDNNFLSELDQKLLDQARRILAPTTDPNGADESDSELPGKGEQEQDPEIKFKRSTNFGTAFGLM